MLLEFRIKNYKSFLAEAVFSMMPAPRQKGLDYSIMQECVGSKKFKALSAAVIYGPNASGKTSIIGAMETFKKIVMRGHIRNTNEMEANPASSKLELIPNCYAAEPAPVEFSIKFIEDGVLIEYGFSADIESFLGVRRPRKIAKETFKVNNGLVFSRNNCELDFGSLIPIKHYLIDSFEQNRESAIAMSRSSLSDGTLFLMQGFGAMFSRKLMSLISIWLESKFNVVYKAGSLKSSRYSADVNESSIHIEKTLNEAANAFGATSNSLGFALPNNGAAPELLSIFRNGSQEPIGAIPAELFESCGTMRFLGVFPYIVSAIKTGGVLALDEFDHALHPVAAMGILHLFHNDDINVNHAQLVFNTNNPTYLTSAMLRRDEVKFDDRDDEKGSVHYTLSDFGTTGKSSVRKLRITWTSISREGMAPLKTLNSTTCLIK
jgi:hypothetical protein